MSLRGGDLPWHRLPGQVCRRSNLLLNGKIAHLVSSLNGRHLHLTPGTIYKKWEEDLYLWLILSLLFAALEALAVLKNLSRLEFFAKPAVMLCLLFWLYTGAGLQENALWFGVGVLFSLVGDLLLLIALDAMFLLGLVAFLFAHVSYLNGFREELTTVNVGSAIVGMFIAVNLGRLLRRIVGALQTRGENKLVIPVIAYGIVISIMLYAAMSTFYNPLWKTNAALLVSVGAFLFWISDLILAWNKFVSPIKNGNVWIIVLYHLGQIGLIAGVINQFGVK